MAVVNRKPRRFRYYPQAKPAFVSITVGAINAGAINVACVLKDPNRNPTAVGKTVEVYLSDDSAGATGLVGTAPSGGWAIGTNGVLATITTNKWARVWCAAGGLFDITVTHSGAKTCYLNVIVDGQITSSTVLTFT